MSTPAAGPRRRVSTRVGCFPGSFDPPTVAHLHIATVAAEQLALDIVELTLSIDTLGKDAARQSSLAERIAAVERAIPADARLRVRVTSDRLLVDIAAGAQAVILGADKWHQIHDPRWYGGDASVRDAAISALPTVALVPRPPAPTPASSPRLVILDVPRWVNEVSSTAVRAGRTDWLARPPSTG
jgi:nicotinic acid mononucleotide adenylyltransferase